MNKAKPHEDTSASTSQDTSDRAKDAHESTKETVDIHGNPLDIRSKNGEIKLEVAKLLSSSISSSYHVATIELAHPNLAGYFPRSRVSPGDVAGEYNPGYDDGDSQGASRGTDGVASDWQIPMETFTSKRDLRQRHPKSSKSVESYYKAQDDLISSYENVTIDTDNDDSKDKQNIKKENLMKKVRLLSKITLVLNVVMTGAKAVAGAMSGSISLISSLIDSLLDIFSGLIMMWASRAMKRRDPYAYPIGRTKLEPVAIIILAVLMGFASVELIKEAIVALVRLAGSASATLPVVNAMTLAITGGSIVIKLALWFHCRKVDNPSIQAMSLDHRNDVVSNTVAIICGYLGSQNFRDETDLDWMAFADPIGAIAISVYIVFNWWRTGAEQIRLLTGHTAGADFLSKITWVSINHHAKITKIETVRAFHFGNNFLVEVDIVLPNIMELQEAHDIGESLQQKLEGLGEVERAFVHLDYEYSHKPSMEHKHL